MNANQIYNKLKRHTSDKIVLALAKSYLSNNKTIKWIKNIFGLNIDQKIELDIYKEYNRKYRKFETVFKFTTGFLFKKEFRIRLA